MLSIVSLGSELILPRQVPLQNGQLRYCSGAYCGSLRGIVSTECPKMGSILPGNVSSTRSLPNLLIFLQKAQHINKFNHLFIPINGGRRHWYSACIDYVRKRIDIYDSLQEVCVSNRSKPAGERQNANLMLVSVSF